MNKLVLPNRVMLGEVSRLLGEGKEVEIMTKGVSMLPFIRGEIDSVLLAKKDKVSEGDIVLSEIAEGHYVLHRVRSVDGDSVVLKGDGNLKGTENCRLSDIRGTAVRIIGPRRARDPYSPGRMRSWRLWCRTPELFRRVVLGVLRRIMNWRKIK